MAADAMVVAQAEEAVAEECLQKQVLQLEALDCRHISAEEDNEQSD